MRTVADDESGVGDPALEALLGHFANLADHDTPPTMATWSENPLATSDADR